MDATRIRVCLLALLVAAHTGYGMTDLRLSADGHRLERAADGSPFLLLSDTQWLLNAYSDAHVLAILDDRAARGFTTVQVFATHAFADSPSRTDHAGNLPFLNNNPEQPNAPYWNRWRWVCDQAAARGLHVILVVGEPGRISDTSVPWRFTDNTTASHARAYQYGRQAAAFFATATNVIFALGQDSQANGSVMPGLGTCFNAAGWRAMAEGVADGVNGVNAQDGQADYTTTLMTYHGLEKWSGGYKDDISAFFQNDDWIDLYGPEVFHDNGFCHEIVNRDYNLPAPVKPSFVMEGSYEAGTYEGALIVPAYVRIEAWHSLLGGGCGYAYGHYRNWSQTAEIAFLGDTAATQMAHLAAFAAQQAWWLWVPDSSLITAGAGSGATRKVAIRSSAGDGCVVYYPDATSATVRNPMGIAASATWFDPRNGHMTGDGLFAAGQSRTLTPPAGWEDAVVFLADSARTTATPALAPNGGTFADAVDVTLACATDGAEVRYTTDGGEPTAASPLAAGAVRLTASATLKARAFKAGLAASRTAAAAYVIATSSGSVVADDFDDGSLAVNPGGTGGGWNRGAFNGAPLPTEADGAFAASMGTENGVGAIHGKDVFTFWDDAGATVSWTIRDITVQTPHAFGYYLAYCWEMGIISANADSAGSAWLMSGPNRKGGLYISLGKKNNSNTVELWVAVSNQRYSGVEGTSGFLYVTRTSSAPGGLGTVFAATFPVTVTARVTRGGWTVTTDQAGVAPISGNWTTDLVRSGNDASISDEFAAGAFLFTGGRNHQIDGSGNPYPPNSGRIERITVSRQAAGGGNAGGASELLSNTGFETNTTGWAANGGSISRVTTPFQSGAAACRAYSRPASWAGPRQVIKSALLENGPGDYAVSAWLKLASGGDTGRVQLGVKVAGIWTWFTATGSIPAGAWGEVSGTLPVTWSGTLEDAWFAVNGTSATSDLFVDACSLRRAVAAPPPEPGDLRNGSFETGLDGWTVTAADGGAAACAVLDSQGARDSTHALALGNMNAAGNAVLVQTVRTVPGTAYELRFDYGAFGAAGRQQRLRVELLDGAAVPAGELFTALGPGNFLPSGTTFSTRTLPFTASAAAVTLRFTDETTLPDSNSVDGMLDRILLVAVAARLPIAPRTLLIVR